MSDKSLRAYDEIRNRVEQSRVVGADETGVKISGMFKTDIGADTFSQIQSIAQTAKKNNQNPFLAILAVANNH
jgi:hypothetical protein